MSFQEKSGAVPGFNSLFDYNACDILDQIFDYLSPLEWESCRLVCKRWQNHFQTGYFRHRRRAPHLEKKLIQLIWAKERPSILWTHLVPSTADADAHPIIRRARKVCLVDPVRVLIYSSKDVVQLYSRRDMRLTKTMTLAGLDQNVSYPLDAVDRIICHGETLVVLSRRGRLSTFSLDSGQLEQSLTTTSRPNSCHAPSLSQGLLLPHPNGSAFTVQHFNSHAYIYEKQSVGCYKVASIIGQEDWSVQTLSHDAFLLHHYDRRANVTRLLVQRGCNAQWRVELPAVRVAVIMSASLRGDSLFVTGKSAITKRYQFHFPSGQLLLEEDLTPNYDLLKVQNVSSLSPPDDCWQRRPPRPLLEAAATAETVSPKAASAAMIHLWDALRAELRLNQTPAAVRLRVRLLPGELQPAAVPEKTELERDCRLAYDQRGLYAICDAPDGEEHLIGFDFSESFEKYHC